MNIHKGAILYPPDRFGEGIIKYRKRTFKFFESDSRNLELTAGDVVEFILIENRAFNIIRIGTTPHEKFLKEMYDEVRSEIED